VGPRLAAALRIVACAAVLVCSASSTAQPADPLALITELGSADRATVERAVTAIESSSTTPGLADAIFRAARACEDTLADPRRALALYERLLRELPDSRPAISAERRVDALRVQVGAKHEFAQQAGELAKLIADAESGDPADIERRAGALANAAWPGAPDAALWLAEWLRRHGRLADAQACYAEVVARWPNTKHALLGLRGGAGNALDARDWDRAESLATQLPSSEEADRIVRDDLLRLARRGRTIDRFHVLAWIVILVGFAAMIGSFVEATVRGGRDRPALRPPIEVVFLLPIAAVLVGVALTTHQLVAPAVLMLSIGGLLLAWLSGATLDTLRRRGRAVRGRALLHVAICFFAVLGLGYVSLVRDNLLDMVIETVRFGPEP
jgi:tetratricopeptide (TPR) repeat protein